MVSNEYGLGVGILGSNVEKQKEIINNINLYKNLKEIVDNYLKMLFKNL